MSSRAFAIVLVAAAIAAGACTARAPAPGSARVDNANGPEAAGRLPTGVRLDPAGKSIRVGNMPTAALLSPDGRYLVLSLSGWRTQGIEVVSRASGRMVQELAQPGAFIGMAWSADAHRLYVSGGVSEMVYAYEWRPDRAKPAALTDSLSLGRHDSTPPGSRYSAGIALARDGRTMYVAENLADSIAVIDLASHRVVQRVATGPYPYGVVVSPDGRVYASAWGASYVNVYHTERGGRLVPERPIDVARHPSALLLTADGTRLFVASASTDRVAVVDTRVRHMVRQLRDPPPDGAMEGSTPNALALSADESRLYVAEADANAIAVFDLSPLTSGRAAARGADSLAGRIPVEWYPTAVAVASDTLWVVNGKGRGTGPNPNGPQPSVSRAKMDPRGYTLGQLEGTVMAVPEPPDARLPALTARVAHANGWDVPRAAAAKYPPFEHVIYIIKENRTYDQVLGDLRQADGDTSLLFFPRPVSPNHHALAERFGIFDRFFVNAEVSAQGHPWSTAAYVTDYTEKTTPDIYRNQRPEPEGKQEVDDPANGYIWDEVAKKGLWMRDYGEWAEPVPREKGDTGAVTYRSSIASLEPYTSPTYPPFDLSIEDQRRIDAWLAEFSEQRRTAHMPSFELIHLPDDHTSGGRAGARTPRAYMADNDLALGRLVEAVSSSPFWKSTVIFVLEDDAQDGPDHVDSHRSVMLVVSAWNRGGVIHRFVNTTDVIATMEEMLGLGTLSQFDHFGRPLRDIWSATPDLRPYRALVPAQSLEELNAATGASARASRHLDLSSEDRIDDDEFNHLLWRMLKGDRVPYPAPRRVSLQEMLSGQ